MRAITLCIPNNTGDIEPPDLATAMANLAREFAFTVVDRCPAPGCEFCRPNGLPAAA